MSSGKASTGSSSSSTARPRSSPDNARRPSTGSSTTKGVPLGKCCRAYLKTREWSISCLVNYVGSTASVQGLCLMLPCSVYTIVTELPAVFLLYNSAVMSSVFLLAIFAVSVWNGAGFYIEVFGRKYVHLHPSVPFPLNFPPL